MSTQKHVLLLGAHGKIAQQMIPIFLAKSWAVTALIRDPAQKDEIRTNASTANSSTDASKLQFLVHSLSDIKTPHDAQGVISKAPGVNTIVWSAGAGGKGGKDGTYAIDQHAACAFAKAAADSSQIVKYLTISAINARRHPAKWWGKEQAEATVKAGKSIADYTEAKTVADECLTTFGLERQERDREFRFVVLRAGRLTDEAPKGKVRLGLTPADEKFQESVTRQDVAATAVELLDAGANGWFDLLEGGESIDDAVKRVVRDGVDAMEGEEVEEMKTKAQEESKLWK